MSRAAANWLRLSGCIAAAGVLIHVAAVFGGPAWYAFFGAPPAIVASARAGTWLAPAGALVIAALMGVCAAYAFSAAGLLPRLPLLRTGLAAIGLICTVRSLLLIPAVMRYPELLNTFEVVASAIWLLAGTGFLVGFWATRNGVRLPTAAA